MEGTSSQGSSVQGAATNPLISSLKWSSPPAPTKDFQRPHKEAGIKLLTTHQIKMNVSKEIPRNLGFMGDYANKYRVSMTQFLRKRWFLSASTGLTLKRSEGCVCSSMGFTGSSRVADPEVSLACEWPPPPCATLGEQSAYMLLSQTQRLGEGEDLPKVTHW